MKNLPEGKETPPPGRGRRRPPRPDLRRLPFRCQLIQIPTVKTFVQRDFTSAIIVVQKRCKDCLS